MAKSVVDQQRAFILLLILVNVLVKVGCWSTIHTAHKHISNIMLLILVVVSTKVGFYSKTDTVAGTGLLSCYLFIWKFL